MSDEKKNQRAEELDRFWQIDDLIPKRKPIYRPANTEAVEIEVAPPSIKSGGTVRVGASEAPREKNAVDAIAPSEKARTDAPKTHYIPPHKPERERPEPLLAYTPDSALIRAVRIYPWKSNYPYYEEFWRDAHKLYCVQGTECPREPFFSYVPQYRQMNRAQLMWYLWWRENLRRGEYLETDYSYILLYAYEILNLSGEMGAQESQHLLCRVWSYYRTIYRQLDSYLPEWICDFSLIHGLPSPISAGSREFSAVMSHCALKEYFVPSGGEDGFIAALLAFCSNYDYQKSKFYAPNDALFNQAVPGALRAVVTHLSADGKPFSKVEMDDSRMMRDAYAGALCSHRIRRKIEVEYCSFSRSHELRFFITDVVKYTENAIRAVLGVRSRLSIYALPNSAREILDGYLSEALPKRQSTKKKEPEDESYAALYDLPHTELSLGNAAKIEQLSWETTERLVEAFEEETELETEPLGGVPSVDVPEKTETCAHERITEPTRGANSDDVWLRYRSYLSALAAADMGALGTAVRASGVPEEVLVDEINACAADLFGDILLEEDAGSFAVIEDYRELLDEILNG